MTSADWLRQVHVAVTLGFRPMQRVLVTGTLHSPVSPWTAVVYATHNKSRVACVARCSDGKGTTVGFKQMRHFPGSDTAELKRTYEELNRLRSQLGKWAPPIQGWED